MNKRVLNGKRFWGWVVSLGIVFAIGFAGLRILAPQILVLAGEGFPSATWPAPGQFVVVSGKKGGAAKKKLLPEQTDPLPPAAVERLRNAQGRALLVDRTGRPIQAEYLSGTTSETRFNSYSLVKSLVGVLILRAIADGLIDGLDADLRNLLGPDAPPVSLGSVLSMTSGLALYGEPPKEELVKPLDDNQFSPFSPVARLHAYGVENLLDRIEVHPELEGQFHYQSANTALLGLVLERAYGEPLPDILSRLIWQPAGAADADWRVIPTTGRASAYCCLYARPYDWLLVGRYLLNNGSAGAPFLPDDLWRSWILPELAQQERAKGSYGWQIRHDVLDRPGEALQGPFAYMMGHGGQMVYLLPEQDMVVVRFGAQPQLLHSTLYELQ